MDLLWVALGEHNEFQYLLLETFIEKDFENWKSDYFVVSLAEKKKTKKRNTELKTHISVLHKIKPCWIGTIGSKSNTLYKVCIWKENLVMDFYVNVRGHPKRTEIQENDIVQNKSSIGQSFWR